MLKVLLVEDELFARSMIRSAIDWEGNGYHICGECSDGTEAVDALKYQKPDIIITDIKMNKMNGDELVEFIAKKYPHICTIVLSSYDDYQYVRKTLNNNAVDYLIKNDLNAETLLGVLGKAREKLKEGPHIKKTTSNIEELKRNFVIRLIAGVYEKNVPSLKNDMMMLKLKMENKNISTVLMRIDNYESVVANLELKDRILLEFSVCNIANEVIENAGSGFLIHLEKERYVALVSLSEIKRESEAHQRMTKIVKQISFCLLKYLNLTASFSIGKADTLQNLAANYEFVVKQMEELYFCKNKSIIIYGGTRMETNLKVQEGLRISEERRIKEAIINLDKESLFQILEELFKIINENHWNRISCSILFSELIIIIVQSCKTYNIKLSEIYFGDMTINEYMTSLSTLEYCRTFLEESFSRLLDSIDKVSGSNNYSEHTRKVIAYMNRHYKEQVFLSEVAEKFNLSSGYLSTIFKDDVGMSFTEYLNDLRLSYAESRLKQKEIKLEEVMSESGYSSYSHFSKCFKKKYGMNPKKYMNMNHKREIFTSQGKPI